jgi:general secretion pathway protein K
LESKAKALTKVNQLTYLLATQRLTIAGISQGVNPEGFILNEDDQFINLIAGDEIRVDGHVYEYDNKQFSYSIQSHRGLLSINTSDQLWLKKWIHNREQNPLDTNRMLDHLFDYADENHTQRPVGKDGKNDANIRNYLLQSCSELFSVAYWSEFLSQHPDFLSHCSLERSPVLNLNQVPISLWEILWPRSTEQLKLSRDNGKWFAALSDVYLIEPSITGLFEQYLTTQGSSEFTINVIYLSSDMSLKSKNDAGNPKRVTSNNIATASISIGTGNSVPITIKP